MLDHVPSFDQASQNEQQPVAFGSWTSTEKPLQDLDGTAAIAGDASKLLLHTLSQAARYAPIPYLKESAEAALYILEKVQVMRENKTAFNTLAIDACELVYAALSAWKDQWDGDKQKLSDELFQQLGGLSRTLSKVHHFAKSRARRNVVIRFIRVTDDTGKIASYRAEIKAALDRFGMQSQISIRGTMSRIEAQQQAILRALGGHAPSERSIPSFGKVQASRDFPSYPSSPSPPACSSPYPWPSNTVPGKVTTIGGNYVVNNNSSSVTTTNSRNVTNISTTNSNNNYAGYSGHGYVPQYASYGGWVGSRVKIGPYKPDGY